MENKEIESKALAFVLSQKSQWEDCTAYVTEKVAFNIRNLIRQCRKNYWGVFDKPYDEETGKQKIWIPLTFETIESGIKNHDLDTKDLNFRARKEVRRMMSKVVKGYVMNELREMDYGELIDKASRDLEINGTVIWKIQKDDTGKPKITNVDRLNFYIDPTADSIQSTDAVIERVVMTPDEVKRMKGWINTDGIQGAEGIERTGDDVNNRNSKNKFVEVYIYEGLAPKYFLTGKPEDTDFENLRIIVSDKGGEKEEGGNVHLIEKLPMFGDKPQKSYEECWMTRVSGRWDGVGTAEKIIMLQLWMNIVVNTRKTRNEVASLGLFKIKDGSGITPQMLKRLPVNGAIKVNSMDDIEQFVMQEATASSYNEENTIKTWSQRVSQAFEATTGETMAATTTATVGAIQSRSGAAYYVQIKKQMAMWQERVMNNHLVPMCYNSISKDDIINLSLDTQELREYDDEYADLMANEYIKEKGEEGVQYIDISEIEKVKEQTKKELEKGGVNRYHKMKDSEDVSEYIADVYVDNERIDKNVVVTDLINTLKLAPEYKESILTKIFDMLGLDLKLGNPQEQVAQGQTNNALPQEAQMTQALTGKAMGLNG